MQNYFSSEAQLWQSFKKGNVKAFDEIYRIYVGLLYNYGMKMTNNEHLVEDCIQDLFTSLWKSKESIADTHSIKNYLVGSFRNNLVRLIKSQQKVNLIDEISFFEGKEDDPMETIVNEEKSMQNRQDLAKKMSTLSSRQREAIFLKYIAEHSYEEICSIMSINYQSVRNLISTGIKKMQEN